MRNELVKLQKDVQDWDEKELKFANSVIVAELKHKHAIQDQEAISKFRIGQRVKFHDKSFQIVEGPIEKINSRTISLGVCTDGKRWRLHPSFIESIVE